MFGIGTVHRKSLLAYAIESDSVVICIFDFSSIPFFHENPSTINYIYAACAYYINPDTFPRIKIKITSLLTLCFKSISNAYVLYNLFISNSELLSIS